MLQEFKAFALRGNVMDLAVGVIIGAAFGKIVASMTNDVIMPVVGLMLGKVDFSQLFITLSGADYATLQEAVDAGAPVLKYGVFMNSVLDFVILAFIIFMMVRAMNKLKKAEPPPPPAGPTPDQVLLTEIRDALKNR
ncbi:MAG: large conductance mechanosensitive channel protein MscL [Gammaproteobacteria bacterium]|jgi:large conductance mechanosensitive channel|nr:large conductance mechanosensitive channel protein MscL [Gammaproteobacteria bacterium]